MPTHLPDALHDAANSLGREAHLTLAATDELRTIEIDWDAIKRDLNDRISMAVEYGYWKSSADVVDDQLPHAQLKTVEKILAICRTETVLYLTGTIRPDGAGALAILTSRLIVCVELSPAENPENAGAFTSRVWARSRRDITNIELVDVSEARHDVNWPARLRITVRLGDSDVSLPLAKGHQVTREENLAALLPALLEDLDRR
jgi:hypothetical protein